MQYGQCWPGFSLLHCNDVIMGTIASQITSLKSVYSTIYSGADQRKHQSSASLAFVRGIHRWSMNSPHKWPATRIFIPFDDVNMVHNTTCKMRFGARWRMYFISLQQIRPVASLWLYSAACIIVFFNCFMSSAWDCRLVSSGRAMYIRIIDSNDKSSILNMLPYVHELIHIRI